MPIIFSRLFSVFDFFAESAVNGLIARLFRFFAYVLFARDCLADKKTDTSASNYFSIKSINKQQFIEKKGFLLYYIRVK